LRLVSAARLRRGLFEAPDDVGGRHDAARMEPHSAAQTEVPRLLVRVAPGLREGRHDAHLVVERHEALVHVAEHLLRLGDVSARVRIERLRRAILKADQLVARDTGARREPRAGRREDSQAPGGPRGIGAFGSLAVRVPGRVRITYSRLLKGGLLTALTQDPLVTAPKRRFEETSRHADVMRFVSALAAKNDPRLRVTTFGRARDRRLPLLVLSAHG
jgi:hypothetical protein